MDIETVDRNAELRDSGVRYEAFGLNIPANPSAPEPVDSVTAAPLGNGRFELHWPYATRAVRYRVETFIVGVDTEFQNKGSFKDLGTIVKGFTAGQTVEVRIVAGKTAAMPRRARRGRSSQRDADTLVRRIGEMEWWSRGVME